MIRYLYSVCLSLLLVVSFQSFGQIDSLEQKEEKNPINIKGYVSAYYERSPVSDGYANHLGLQGAVIFKQHVQLGLYGVSYTNSNYQQRLIFPNIFQMNYKHGGFMLGYRTNLKHNFEFNVESKLGFGEVKWEQVETNSAFLTDRFTMLHLQGSLDYLLSKFIVVNGFLGYRWMNGLDITGLADEDFKGVYYGMAIKIGLFK